MLDLPSAPLVGRSTGRVMCISYHSTYFHWKHPRRDFSHPQCPITSRLLASTRAECRRKRPPKRLVLHETVAVPRVELSSSRGSIQTPVLSPLRASSRRFHPGPLNLGQSPATNHQPRTHNNPPLMSPSLLAVGWVSLLCCGGTFCVVWPGLPRE